MTPKLKEPKVLTDSNNDAVCILPIGFEFDDGRWEQVWQLHEKLNQFIDHDELLELFPDDPALITNKYGRKTHHKSL